MHAERPRAAVCALRAAACGAPSRGVHAVAARAEGAALRKPLQDARERAGAQSGPGTHTQHTHIHELNETPESRTRTVTNCPESIRTSRQILLLS